MQNIYPFRHARILISLFLSLALLTTLSGCGKEREQVHRAFYEWRSNARYTPSDLRLLDSLNIDRLYIHFFDVQPDPGSGAPVPQSSFQPATPLPEGIEIVPTIYVTNEVMKRVEGEEELKELAGKIENKISAMLRQLKIDSCREVQIDCDWTASSKAAYFSLLRELRRLNRGRVLSATIRLHQVKYRAETGIPPVDRGMLMVYNVGTVTSLDESNSIFDPEEVERYLGELDTYPLPLDVALPVFNWAVRFHFDRFALIIDNVDHDDLAADPAFRQIGENRWQAIRPTMLRDEPISSGDIIRVEQIDLDRVMPIADRIASDIDHPEITLSLYRYDPLIPDRHELTQLQNLYHLFD